MGDESLSPHRTAPQGWRCHPVSPRVRPAAALAIVLLLAPAALEAQAPPPPTAGDDIRTMHQDHLLQEEQLKAQKRAAERFARLRTTFDPPRAVPSHLEVGDGESFLRLSATVTNFLACDDPPGATCSMDNPDPGSFLGTTRWMAWAVMLSLSIIAVVLGGFQIALGTAAPVQGLWRMGTSILIPWILLLFWHQGFAGMQIQLPSGYAGTTEISAPATIPNLIQALPLWIGASMDADFGAMWGMLGSVPAYAFNLAASVSQGFLAEAMTSPGGIGLRDVYLIATSAVWGAAFTVIWTVLIVVLVLILVGWVLFRAFSQFLLAEILVQVYGLLGFLFVPFYVLPATRFLFTGWLRSYLGINLFALLTKLMAGVAVALVHGHMEASMEFMSGNTTALGLGSVSWAWGNIATLVLYALAGSALLSSASSLSQALASGSAAATPTDSGPLASLATGAAAAAGTVATGGVTGVASGLATRAAGGKNRLPGA